MSGGDELLIDTNLLLYSFDHNEPIKGTQSTAVLKEIFAAGAPLIPAQVISEFYWNATRKLKPAVPHARAVFEIQRFQQFARITPLTWDILVKALDAVTTHGMA